MRFSTRISPILVAGALAACSSGQHVSTLLPAAEQPGAASASFREAASAPACPAVGNQILRQKYATSKFAYYSVKAGTSVHIEWQVNYANMPNDNYPRYWFKLPQPLSACYANSTPVGEIVGGILQSDHSSSFNGVYSADQRIGFNYRAPATVKSLFRYVVITFVPRSPSFGYTAIPGALIQIVP
jgi:hypothetical protein